MTDFPHLWAPGEVLELSHTSKKYSSRRPKMNPREWTNVGLGVLTAGPLDDMSLFALVLFAIVIFRCNVVACSSRRLRRMTLFW